MLKSYFCAGKYVILDSGFCVLKALIELKKHGIYSCALIHKHRFWPSGVPGSSIDEQITGRKVGDVGVVQRTREGVSLTICGQ